MALSTNLRFIEFYRKYEGQFLANFGGHTYFFRIFTDVSSEIWTPKNGKKSTFQILKAYTTKTVEVMAKTIYGAMLDIKRTNFWHRPKFYDFSKIRKLSLKICLFLTQKSRFIVNN